MNGSDLLTAGRKMSLLLSVSHRLLLHEGGGLMCR